MHCKYQLAITAYGWTCRKFLTRSMYQLHHTGSISADYIMPPAAAAGCCKNNLVICSCMRVEKPLMTALVCYHHLHTQSCISLHTHKTSARGCCAESPEVVHRHVMLVCFTECQHLINIWHQMYCTCSCAKQMLLVMVSLWSAPPTHDRRHRSQYLPLAIVHT